MAFEDFSYLSIEELREEIRREEEILAERTAELQSLRDRKTEIENTIKNEKLLRYPDRVEAREERIRNLEELIARREDRVTYWAEIVFSLTVSIARQEARSRRFDISPVERAIARRVATALRRSRGAYRSWITRYEAYLESDRRSLGQLRRWQVTEITLMERLRLLNSDLTEITARIPIVESEISREETRLTRKREELEIKYIHLTLTANVETEHEGTVLVISITLDFDVKQTEMMKYRTNAVEKIRLWFEMMFYGNVSAEPSVEYSDPDPEVLQELIVTDEEVTSIHYFWYWHRTGLRPSEGEQDEGDITWDEDIPLGERAGAPRGRQKGEKYG